MPDHGGNRTYDLWNTSPMLCQLSYAVWSVRVCDISEQNLVPSISMLSTDYCKSNISKPYEQSKIRNGNNGRNNEDFRTESWGRDKIGWFQFYY